MSTISASLPPNNFLEIKAETKTKTKTTNRTNLSKKQNKISQIIRKAFILSIKTKKA